MVPTRHVSYRIPLSHFTLDSDTEFSVTPKTEQEKTPSERDSLRFTGLHSYESTGYLSGYTSLYLQRSVVGRFLSPDGYRCPNLGSSRNSTDVGADW